VKSYLELIPLSAKAHKRENRLSILCITISVFLVTAIFSMTEMVVRQETNRLIRKHGVSEVQSFFESTAVQSLFPIALVLSLFILLAGVFMISGSLSGTAARRTKFFGLMRCIGMSRQQVMHLVRLEALIQCKTAVPLGLILGTIASWGLSACMKYFVGGEFSDMPQFGISLIGLGSGALLGVITVLIAAESPAKRAASIPPVEAVSDNAGASARRTLFPQKGLRIETALGINHAFSSKRNLILIAGSFALSIILFLSFSVMIDLVNCLLPQSVSSGDIEIFSTEGSNTIDPDLIRQISGIRGVKRVYGRQSFFDMPAETTGARQVHAVDIISFSPFELDALQKDGMLKYPYDVPAVIENQSAFVISDQEMKPETAISAGGAQLRIAGQLKYDIFSTDGNTGGKTTLIVSNRTFTEITGISGYHMLSVQLSSDADDESVKEISDLTDKNCIFRDERDANNHGTYLAFLICTYTFLAVISLVAILNIVNSISIRVSAGIRQYGTMRAVGMEERQLVCMIASEAMTYGITGGLLGLCLGLPFSRWLYGFLITSHFSYAHWTFPICRILTALVFLGISVWLGVSIPVKQVRNQPVVEMIRSL